MEVKHILLIGILTKLAESLLPLLHKNMDEAVQGLAEVSISDICQMILIALGFLGCDLSLGCLMKKRSDYVI